MKTHYIYIHKNPSNKEPYYIGQGTYEKNSKYEIYTRAHCTKRRSFFWNNTYNKYGADIEILDEGLNEKDANNLEKHYIKKIGRRDKHKGPLVNLTDGGTGEWKKPMSKESRELIGRRKYPKGETHHAFNKKRSKYTREKISDSCKGYKFTKEQLDNLKKSKAGKIPPMKGKGYLIEGEKNGMFGKSVDNQRMKEIAKLSGASRAKKNTEIYSNEIKNLYNSGMNCNQIAKKIKRNFKLVSRILKELNLK